MTGVGLGRVVYLGVVTDCRLVGCPVEARRLMKKDALRSRALVYAPDRARCFIIDCRKDQRLLLKFGLSPASEFAAGPGGPH